VERSELLPPGRAKPIRIMSEDFTLYRGEDGIARVVAHRCPHRGTQLSVGFVEAGDIRCLYHGWKFDGSGQCVEQPAENSEFAAKVRIPSYPTREHIGLIFAYFGAGEPPPFPPFPGFADGALIETNIDLFKCNFFQSWENDWDEFHVAWTHRTGGVHVAPQLGDERFVETDYGIRKRARKSDGTTRNSIFFLPATVWLTIPSPSWFRQRNAGPALRQAYLIHVPVDDHAHLFFASMGVIVPDAEREAYLEQYREYRARLDARPAHEIAEPVLRGEKTLSEVYAADEHPFMAVIEDMAAQPGQGSIADRGEERLGQSDRGIIMLRKLWARELQAFAETGRGKVWSTLEAMPDFE
jgi:5,5'-dehydrodivanillate O-demethylase